MTQPPAARRTGCRHCGGPLQSLLDLGDLHISGFPRVGDGPPPIAPLDLCRCSTCRLVQLRHTVDPEELFRDQYWYRSGVNEVMQAELRDVVTDAVETLGGQTTAGGFVVDVGANDGTLLASYKDHGETARATRVAFEPAANLQAALAHHADVRIPEFFPAGLPLLPALKGRTRILTTIACAYAVEDPGALAKAVAACLSEDGVWIVQFQDLDQMVSATAFDNLCHEHLCYFSLASIERIVTPHGLAVVDAERRAVNGGSLRLLVERAGGRLGRDLVRRAHVEALRKAEATCEGWVRLEQFAWRVGEATRQIRAAVEAVIASGGTVDLYGASTKANTLLQVCGLGPDVIRQAIERSPEKWGRTTVTGIPIVSEAEGRADPATAWLCGIWQFREAVIAREQTYLREGGRIIVPLPTVDLVEMVAWRRP